jgi:Fe-S cluster assembly protein SufD
MAVHPDTVPYLDAFRARKAAAEPGWLATRREAALARFAALGFPTRREEAWRFTDLRPLQKAPFPPAAAAGSVGRADLAPWCFAGGAYRIVLVDGRFAPELSETGTLPPGAWLGSTARALAERPALVEAALAESDETGRQPFAALNAALFADGFVLALEPGVVLDRPVEVIHLGRAIAPSSFHLRSLVALGAGSRADLIETFAGDGAYWTNAVLAVQAGDGAALRHVRIEDEASAAVHVALTRAALARGARYDAFTLTLGGRLARQDILVRFDGPDASCRVDGAFLLRGEQEATTATFIDHAAPGCTTRELWKGVVDDRAHGVFLGRIAVRPDAQRTDAQQTNRNLLLSRRAAVDTKPELEILADDVKCSHGATVGDLEEASLFYLRARGIPEAEARRMLVEAFAMDAVERIEPPLREHVAAHLRRWLGSVEA